MNEKRAKGPNVSNQDNNSVVIIAYCVRPICTEFSYKPFLFPFP